MFSDDEAKEAMIKGTSQVVSRLYRVDGPEVMGRAVKGRDHR